jgi:hypothetical protein
MANARRATVSMTYNNKTATQMAEYLSSFTYSDVASGSSDSITVELGDKDRHWIGGWFPQKGDRLKPIINRINWDTDGKTTTLNCGTFVIDDFSFKGGPIRCTIQALALPSTSGFKATERTYTYESTTLKEIGQKVASRSGLTLYYEASNISIESVAQDNQTDCSFYNDLLVKFGLAMKIYSDKLVVFDEATYEAKAVVATITEADFEPGWQWNTSLAGTYTGVKYSYTHTTKNKTFTVDIGSGDRYLTCDKEASNQTEATLIALAALNNANKSTTTMKITMRTPAWNIVATNCIQINGLGNLSGKYYVEQVDTTVGEGTKFTLSLRKVEKRFVKKAEPVQPVKVASTTAEAAKSSTTFKKGDKVRVKKGARTYNGVKLASFVYTTVYTVIQVGGKNLSSDRIVIGINGVVTAAVAASNLYYA